ncbi:DUF6207 family protein [Streptomyces flaveolus]|uniref:DUF6207 family protein n=1 Tax=Streptomyces flaveolus TaxID=67297 RepID=UPI0033170C79
MRTTTRTAVAAGCVVPVKEGINDVHVSEPRLVVVDVAAADDETAFAFHAALAARRATTSVERTTRDADQAGVRLRCYLDLRQPLNPPGHRGAW